MKKDFLGGHVLKKETLECRNQEGKAARDRREANDDIRPLARGRGGIEIPEVTPHQRELIPDLTGGLSTLESAKQSVSGDAQRPRYQQSRKQGSA
jgi:hypothetical protein